jgi:zinc transporter 1/2/3
LIGTGIIISTAFIHLFIDGVILLRGDCVSNLFQSYSSWAAVLAVFGALIAHSLEIMTSSSDVRATPASDIERPLIGIETPSTGHSSLVSLEFGLVFHSIMIGITLGTTSIDFVNLLIAICFHQFFEGLALSSIINEFAFSQRGKKINMLALYVISTPLGCLIGIWTRNLSIFDLI